MGTTKIAVTCFVIDCPKPRNIPAVKEVMSYNRRISRLLLQIKTKVSYLITWFYFSLRSLKYYFSEDGTTFHLLNNVLKTMMSCLKTVRKSNFTCNSFLIYPVVQLIHVMKCAVLQIAVRPPT